MKKRVSIFVVSLSLFCGFLFSSYVFPVNPGRSAGGSSGVIDARDFPSIQAAIDNASSGETVVIGPGTFSENLTIDRSITLAGAGRDTTVIQGASAAAVILIASDNVTVEDLTVTSEGANDVGISIDNHAFISVTNVRITGTATGLALRFCVNSLFSDNVVDNNTVVGILSYIVGHSVFSRNLVYGNSIGIVVYTSSGNTFAANTLVNNFNEQGMSVAAGSRLNYFYHNNFENVVSTDQSPNSQNNWSINGEGNFWAGYSGVDADGDGIGDSVHEIDANNNDSYPLMGVFSELTVVANGTYTVDVISNSTVSNLRYGIGRETGNGMITFDTTGQTGGTGFARMMIPTSLMSYPFTVVTNEGLASEHLLSVSNQTNAYLYFTFDSTNQTVTVSSSNDLQLYSALLDKYNKLQAEFDSLNSTYQDLLKAYNTTLQTLTDNYVLLLENLTQLQNDYLNLSSSFQQNLTSQSVTAQNMRNFAYVFAALTAAFLVTIAYLSTRFQASKKTPSPQVEDD